MPCCPFIIQTFGGVASTAISYAGEFGDTPQVEVMYFVDGVLKNAASVITFAPGMINVDHGGIQTGIIKIS